MRYADMPVLHEVNGVPTPQKLDEYDYDNNVYFRYQDKKYEIGEQSWMMGYSTPEEAEEDGYTTLPGKSCWGSVREMVGYTGTFDDDCVMLVVKGSCVGFGHDGECVVDVWEVLEIWDQKQFKEVADTYLYEEWEGVA